MHLFLVRIHGHEKISALGLPESMGMTGPNSKPRHWLASNPFDSNLSTGCYLRIELLPWMPPAKKIRHVGYWPIALFRCKAARRSLSGQSGHQMAGRTDWIGRE